MLPDGTVRFAVPISSAILNARVDGILRKAVMTNE